MRLSSMLRFRRFKRLASSYGAELDRWPDTERAMARTLVATMPESLRFLEESRALEEALRSAKIAQDSKLWALGEQDAALIRLRAGVAGHISSTHGERRRLPLATDTLQTTWVPAMGPVLYWQVGTVTSGGLAVMMGLWMGWMLATPSAPASILATLMTAPIQGLIW